VHKLVIIFNIFYLLDGHGTYKLDNAWKGGSVLSVMEQGSESYYFKEDIRPCNISIKE
jgi:hypothetical protein